MARRVHFNNELHKKHRIVLNVSGQRYTTERKCLQRHPHTLLGSEMLTRFFDPIKKEYFFDRDPYLFRYILNFYQCGKLHSSPDDCPVAFKDELDFFGIPICELEDCCWYTTNTDEKEKHPCHYAVRKASMKAVHSGNYLDWNKRENKQGIIKRKKIPATRSKNFTQPSRSPNHVPLTEKRCGNTRQKSDKRAEFIRAKHSEESENSTEKCSSTRKCEINCRCQPHKSKIAQRLFYFLYGLFIVLSVATTTVETIDCDDGVKCLVLYPDLFFAFDATFVAVFTVEFLIRFAWSKKRCAFMKDFFNVIDLLAILPYYISLIATQFVTTDSVTLLITLRVLRVARIMKLTRGSTRLKSLLYTLRNCSTDLLFLYFTFTLGILLFGSVLYFVESGEDFRSIPHSLWYTCVTMMTTGYGDVVPVSVLGKVIGGMCCVCGVVIMSLPIPIMQDKKVIVQN